MKINWNKRYTTYAIYAAIVSAAVILCVFIGIYIKDVWSGILKVIDVFTPLIYGMIIAYILNPLLKVFEKTLFRKIKNRMARRGFGVALTYIVFLSAFAFLFYLIIPQIATSFRSLQGSLAKYSESLQKWLSDVGQNKDFLAGLVNELEKHIDFTALKDSIGNLFGLAYNLLEKFAPQIYGFLQAFAEQVLKIITGLVFAGYILCSKELLAAQISKIMHVFFKEERIKKIKSGVSYADKTFGKYMLGALIDAIFVGALTAGAMLIFAMPTQYIVLISVTIACTNVIPIFGPFIGGIPSALIIFITDPIKALIFIAIIVVIQQIDGNFVAPRIYGSTTGLPALYVIIAITVMGGFFGIFGMIIGVPVFAILGNLISRSTAKRISKKKAAIEQGDDAVTGGYSAEDYEDFDELEDFYTERPSVTDNGDIELEERFNLDDDDSEVKKQ